jgi:hydroxyacylglutathione hydrolase
VDYTIDVRPVGELQMNAVLLTGGGEALLIDPGAEPAALLRWVEASGCRLTALLATHGHFDHVGAAADLQDACGLPLRCHSGDAEMIGQLPMIQQAYGFPPSRVPQLRPDLEDGSRLAFAGGEILVSHVPGHSPGQVMFRLPGHAVVGDTLFAGSVGRTDLPGGDFGALEKSIRERIYTLPDETVVVCGHGPDTTVGREKASNPFVRG